MKKILLSLAVIAGLSISANAMDKCGSGKCGSNMKMNMKKDMKMDMHLAYKMNAKHELVRPTDYRTWVYVGTPSYTK